MKENLEYTVSINSASERSSYRWCLNERDESGNVIGYDLVPYIWDFYFIGSSFQLRRSITIEKKNNRQRDEAHKVEQLTEIRGVLHSGSCSDGENLTDDVYFSMFGTDRRINQFFVSIAQAENDQPEACYLTAVPSYTSEVAFRNRTTEDLVEFRVQLHRERFGELVRILEGSLVDSVWLRVRKVSGLYSKWSPDAETTFAKILTGDYTITGLDDDKSASAWDALQGLSRERNYFEKEDAEEDPWVVGNVGEFAIGFVKLSQLFLKQAPARVDLSKEFHNEIDEELSQGAFSPSTEAIQRDHHAFNSTALAIQLLSNLRLPLWGIFAVLILLVLK